MKRRAKTLADRLASLVPEYGSRAGLARSLGVAPSTLSRWINSGKVPERSDLNRKVRRRERYYAEETAVQRGRHKEIEQSIRDDRKADYERDERGRRFPILDAAEGDRRLFAAQFAEDIRGSQLGREIEQRGAEEGRIGVEIMFVQPGAGTTYEVFYVPYAGLDQLERDVWAGIRRGYERAGRGAGIFISGIR